MNKNCFARHLLQLIDRKTFVVARPQKKRKQFSCFFAIVLLMLLIYTISFNSYFVLEYQVFCETNFWPVHVLRVVRFSSAFIPYLLEWSTRRICLSRSYISHFAVIWKNKQKVSPLIDIFWTVLNTDQIPEHKRYCWEWNYEIHK